MVIDAKVYNFTSYVDQHPDGPSILKGCGRDASRMFNAIFKHSKTQALLVNYYIGDLK
jgi:cytochrome b involved in lipid metabolism